MHLMLYVCYLHNLINLVLVILRVRMRSYILVTHSFSQVSDAAYSITSKHDTSFVSVHIATLRSPFDLGNKMIPLSSLPK